MERQQDDGIWIIDADAKSAYANERMGEILGTSPSEMVGGASFAYIFPEDVDAAQRLFDAKTRGDAKPFHFKLRRRDGSAVWVDVQGTPMHNAAGVRSVFQLNQYLRSMGAGADENRRYFFTK